MFCFTFLTFANIKNAHSEGFGGVESDFSKWRNYHVGIGEGLWKGWGAEIDGAFAKKTQYFDGDLDVRPMYFNKN